MPWRSLFPANTTVCPLAHPDIYLEIGDGAVKVRDQGVVYTEREHQGDDVERTRKGPATASAAVTQRGFFWGVLLLMRLYQVMQRRQGTTRCQQTASGWSATGCTVYLSWSRGHSAREEKNKKHEACCVLGEPGHARPWTVRLRCRTTMGLPGSSPPCLS